MVMKWSKSDIGCRKREIGQCKICSSCQTSKFMQLLWNCNNNFISNTTKNDVCPSKAFILATAEPIKIYFSGNLPSLHSKVIGYLLENWTPSTLLSVCNINISFSSKQLFLRKCKILKDKFKMQRKNVPRELCYN